MKLKLDTSLICGRGIRGRISVHFTKVNAYDRGNRCTIEEATWLGGSIEKIRIKAVNMAEFF